MLTNDVVSFEQPGPGSYCCHSEVSRGMGMGVSITFSSFTSNLFFVIGKGMSGKLSCMRTGLVTV